MFASCFKIFEDDIAQAIKINANQISKHSFLFLTEKPICFNTEDIFKALNISESKLGGNDWENLRKFSEIHKIVPIQKWEDGIEISLRFFLHDNIQILKYWGSVYAKTCYSKWPRRLRWDSNVKVDGGQSISANGQTAAVPNSPNQLDVKSQNDKNIEAEQQHVKSVEPYRVCRRLFI